jgi:hypothetical protein
MLRFWKMSICLKALDLLFNIRKTKVNLVDRFFAIVASMRQTVHVDQADDNESLSSKTYTIHKHDT